MAKSREVTSAAVFLGAVISIAWLWPALVGGMRQSMVWMLREAPSLRIGEAFALRQGLSDLVCWSLPFLLVAFAVALVASFAQVGPVLSLHPVQPSLRRLDPLRAAKNLFGRGAMYELVKTVVKVLLIGYVAWSSLRDRLPALMHTLGRAPESTLTEAAGCLWAVALRVGIVAAVVAAGDLLIQRRGFLKRMRMTRVEVQREMKESEGDPQRKTERRRAHQEILEHQMLEAVATADCVLINPDHVAVALRYDAETMAAPKVVARGHRLLATRIREIARQRGIPIIRNVPLARALVELELDSEIPAELYQAVAEVLRFVHELSGRHD